jgi:hypothetical protein
MSLNFLLFGSMPIHQIQVHSSLNEHRTGHHVQSKFEGNAVQEIYDTHILLLDTLRAKGSTVLADLYDIMV